MEYNLIQIKSEIINNCKRIFDAASNINNNNSFGTGFTFDKGVDAFLKFILLKANIQKIDGLPKTILPALQEALITKKGEFNSLKILAEELEPFLKKIIYFIDSQDFSNDASSGLMKFYKHLRLDQQLISGNVYYDVRSLPTFKLNPNNHPYRYHLCSSYLVRNEVHNSPNWDIVEIATNLQNLLVVYLYSVFKSYNSLEPRVVNIPLPNNEIRIEAKPLFDDPKIKPIYDFISFNHDTYEIRTEIVKSYILHFLSEKNTKININDIKENCNKQFKTDTNKPFYERILKELRNNKKVDINGLYDNEYSLTNEETKRIKELKENFNFQEQMFYYELREILKNYAIETLFDSILERLRLVISNNYNIDLQEIFNDILEKDNISNLKEFSTYLQSIVNDKTNADNLLRDLIILCGENNFLHKITVSQAFAQITNYTQIEQYIKQQQRIIFLDTNILLHVLCYWYEDSDTYDNIQYKVTRELLRFVENHKNIKLQTSNLYLMEVAYQIKEALLLVPFESFGLFERIGGSNNIFHKYYMHLKYTNELDENINTFNDFLLEFNVNTDDLYQQNSLSKIVNSIKPIISRNDLQIEIIDISNYPYEVIFEDFKNSLDNPRPPETIKNDAKIINYLLDKNVHNEEAIFTSWDNAFFNVRKKLIKKNKSHTWHLFTPSKLVNHLQLLEFKINAESVTNDFLTIIDNSNIQDKTKKTLDTLSELFDIGEETRRRYMNKLQEFSSKYIFNIEDISNENPEENSNKPVEQIIMDLNKYFATKSKPNGFTFTDFKSVFADSSLFDKVITIFQKELEHYLKFKKFSEQFFDSINNLIKESKEKKTNQAS